MAKKVPRAGPAGSQPASRSPAASTVNPTTGSAVVASSTMRAIIGPSAPTATHARALAESVISRPRCQTAVATATKATARPQRNVEAAARLASIGPAARQGTVAMTSSVPTRSARPQRSHKAATAATASRASRIQAAGPKAVGIAAAAGSPRTNSRITSPGST